MNALNTWPANVGLRYAVAAMDCQRPRGLGLPMPQSLPLRADEVIQ